MNIDPRQLSSYRLYPIVVLDSKFSHIARHKIDRVLNVFILVLSLLTLAAYALQFLPDELFVRVEHIFSLAPKLLGACLIFIAFHLPIYIVEMYFRFSYFEEIATPGEPTFDVLKILYATINGDLTKSFVTSRAGELVLLRSGFPPQVTAEFLARRNRTQVTLPMPPAADGPLTLSLFVKYLLVADEELRAFIVAAGVREADVMGSAEWYARSNAVTKRRERWWTRDRLAAVRGVGKDWAYSAAYTLQRFGREISEHYDAYASTMSLKDTEEVASLERILARAAHANAIVVGPSTDATMDVVYNFARSITRGTVTPELEGKKMFTLEYDIIASTLHSSAEYDAAIVAICNDAVRAKNIIIVIPNFSAFLEHARSIGSDAVALLEPYLSSASLQIIGTADSDSFHDHIEQNALLMGKFEKVQIGEPDTVKMLPILEHVAENIEAEHPVIFTFGAIDEAIRSAENYFPDGVFPDKAIDLLIGVAPQCAQAQKTFVERSDILALVKTKTNIPVGEIEAPERAKLLSLEQFLKERVIGQDEAITVIASALRRARAGVRNMKRPIGSALFLGPTGVGKTETVKALADLFFDGEKAISRFDMSEYQTVDALERLIGFSEGERVGTLTKALKERPYGVLLLDEFEKANTKILDLFLQVLDEGYFSDMRGKHVSARNVIIIATSNAGSDLIWEAQEHGMDIAATKAQIVDKLIERGTYKPELLNRFDAVVLFKPLGTTELAQIARLMLQKLQRRLHERNLELIVTDDLVNAAIKYGTDKQFGARPMNRAIQEKIEQAIADKLIRGEIKEGSQVTIRPEELA